VKMKPNLEKEVSTFYVEIKDPVMLRRYFLESSREILQCLKRLETYEQLRKEKTQYIKKLQTISQWINKKVDELQKVTPHVQIREETKLFEQAIPKKRKKSPPIPVMKNINTDTRKKIATELEILEDELNSIESKLDNLSK
jgi:transcriptional regulator NrdR family protein